MAINYADRLMRGSVTYLTLKETVPIGTVLPDRESHVRELLRLETDEEIIEAWNAMSGH